MFKHILVPLDGSLRAEKAALVAGRLAQATGATVTLLQAITLPPDSRSHTLSPEVFGTKTFQVYLELKKKYLMTLAQSLELDGVTIQTVVMHGPAIHTILAYTKQEHVDLIVLCSHGHTGIKHWALGSIAHKITHSSPVPILVIRDRGQKLTLTTAHPLRAIVALDGSPLAESALSPAAHLVQALSAPAQGTLLLTRFVKPPSAEEEMLYRQLTLNPHLVSNEQELSLDYLRSVKKRLEHTFVGNSALKVLYTVQTSKDIAHALTTLAEHGQNAEVDMPYDLIVLSSHGHGGLQHLFSGSITERVLASTTQPLLIVPSQEQAVVEKTEPNEMESAPSL
jgi:nucleotide-binding universal stress UspA family protein